MANVIWTDEALTNLELIVDYIEQFDPQAAVRMALRLISASESLRDFPNRGRPAGETFRELPGVRPYVIRYRVAAEIVYIIRIRHGARRPED
ncbi:type II toxin-antitoxin system RelE/ParE family toxin [Sphingomonas radiodurans]|uniref:type II toxin-antitoxin system RelE/ParE family toxin n=1 Tax=Sphingomonas radiodurans TaxID=2890321 RepID=UPI001E6120E5|nr:type II toxin-antitoxin system RelE/ParE family toxin [Sphingomonas radiodurans]WBH15372.1 type II toxin-antitoxin system RelE/ParE family toxin [Sphingomonas radiodurans]